MLGPQANSKCEHLDAHSGRNETYSISYLQTIPEFASQWNILTYATVFNTLIAARRQTAGTASLSQCCVPGCLGARASLPLVLPRKPKVTCTFIDQWGRLIKEDNTMMFQKNRQYSRLHSWQLSLQLGDKQAGTKA